MTASAEELRKKVEELFLRAVEATKDRLAKVAKPFDSDALIADLRAHFQTPLSSKDATSATSQAVAVHSRQKETPQESWCRAFGTTPEEVRGVEVVESADKKATSPSKMERTIALSDALQCYKSLDGRIGNRLNFSRPDRHVLRFTANGPDTFKVEFWPADYSVSDKPLTMEIVPEEGVEMLQVFFHGGNLEKTYQFEEP